jgi:hypothetical protein
MTKPATVIPALPGQKVVRIYVPYSARENKIPDEVFETVYPVVAWRVPLADINGDAIGSGGDPEPIFPGCSDIESPAGLFAHDAWFFELPGGQLRALGYGMYTTREKERAWALEAAQKWYAVRRLKGVKVIA